MSSYTLPYYGQIIIELARLSIQFLGAIAVARLTVSWALERFKSEKYWEKTFASYVELIELVDRTLLLIEIMIRNEQLKIELSDDREAEIKNSYMENLKELRFYHAKGQLLFSNDIVEILEKVMSTTVYDSYVEWLIHQDDSLRDLKKFAISEGVLVAKSRK